MPAFDSCPVCDKDWTRCKHSMADVREMADRVILNAAIDERLIAHGVIPNGTPLVASNRRRLRNLPRLAR